MSLNLSNDAAFAGRIEDPSEEYPLGKMRGKTGPSQNNGTPFAKAKIWQDWDGFRQYLLTKAKTIIGGSGTPDNATYSQIANAIFSTYGNGYTSRHPDAVAGDTLHPYGRTYYSEVGHRMGTKNGYRLGAYLKNGGVSFEGVSPGAAAVTTRTEVFELGSGDLSGQTISTSGGSIMVYRYVPTGGILLELEGIPKTAKIHGTRIITREESVGTTSHYFNCKINYDGVDWPEVESGYIMGTSGDLYPYGMTLEVDFDPTGM